VGENRRNQKKLKGQSPEVKSDNLNHLDKQHVVMLELEEEILVWNFCLKSRNCSSCMQSEH